ncbi:hypothetical protein MSAN_01500500 [Mycena sanguinolenta]|uniref:Uncharacterized protein n=1 Tax=Mycena sanguinolenta TaxID=230812 RepID=A0A8H6Y2Y2_9AGAR|nr:hypothetical protein MSAN_01500500 [Mycena sanguinolenta]
MDLQPHSEAESALVSTTNTTGSDARYAGAFFPQASAFSIRGGAFTSNVTNNVYSLPPEQPSEFQTIRLGDMKLVNEISFSPQFSVVGCQTRRVGVRRIYHAEIRRDPGMVTVAMYQGDGAEEAGFESSSLKTPAPVPTCRTARPPTSLFSRRLRRVSGLQRGKNLGGYAYGWLGCGVRVPLPLPEHLRRGVHRPAYPLRAGAGAGTAAAQTAVAVGAGVAADASDENGETELLVVLVAVDGAGTLYACTPGDPNARRIFSASSVEWGAPPFMHVHRRRHSLAQQRVEGVAVRLLAAAPVRTAVAPADHHHPQAHCTDSRFDSGTYGFALVGRAG